MKEIKCPKCGNVIAVDETDYAEIVQQVKSVEFNAELERRISEIRKSDEQAKELAAQKLEIREAKARHQFEEKIASLKTELKAKDGELKAAVLEESLKSQKAIAARRGVSSLCWYRCSNRKANSITEASWTSRIATTRCT